MCLFPLSDTDIILNKFSLESNVQEYFTTSTGDSLSIDCTIAYTEEAERKAANMLSKITQEIAQTWCAGKVNVETFASSFTAFGNQVHILLYIFCCCCLWLICMELNA